MSKEDLIPFTKETAREAGRKGGKSKGKNKQIGALLRHAKERGDIIGYMMQLAKTDDPLEAFSWMLENYAKQYDLIETEKNKDKQFTKRDKLMQRFAEFLKLRYGETQRTFFVDTTVQFQDRLAEWRKARVELYNNNNKVTQTTSNASEQDYKAKEHKQ